MKKYLSVTVVVFFVLGVCFSGCGNPISPDILNLNKDLVAPVITITSPADNSAYAKTVEVTGTVTDAVASDDSDNGGEVTSLTYEVAAAGIAATDAAVEDGTFSFQFSAASMSGTIVVTLTAVDRNGNTAVKNLTLLDVGNDIPGFTAIPGNRTVTLSWDPVPGADEYTIYYTTSETAPSEYFSHGTISPADIAAVYDAETGVYRYTLGSHNGGPLENGSMHSFLLKASGTVGDEVLDNYSGVEQAIPLSSSSLCPLVRGNARYISLDWNNIEGASRFNIYRRQRGAAESVRIAYNFEGTEYIDEDVTADTWYYYSVVPAMDNAVASSESAGIAVPFGDSLQVSSLVNTAGSASTGATNGEYIYVADGYDEDTGKALLSVYSIGNPLAPVLTGQCFLTDSGGIAMDLVVEGNYAYIAVSYLGLAIVNISDPANPVVEGTWNTWISGVAEHNHYGAYAVSLDPSGDYVYLAGADYVYKIDVTTRTDPEEDASSFFGATTFNDLTVSNGYIIAAGGSTLRVFDSSDLTEVGSGYSTSISAATVEYKDGKVYVGLGNINPPYNGGIVIYDIDGTGTLSQTSITYDDSIDDDDLVDVEGKVREITFHGDTGYTAYDNNSSEVGIIFWDFTNPAVPSKSFFREAPGNAWSFRRTDNIAVLYAGEGGMQVWDFGDPPDPVSADPGIAGLSSTTSDFVFMGDYSYFLDQPGGGQMDPFFLDTVDMSDVSSPSVISSLDLECQPSVMAAQGDRLYLLDSARGLILLDISDPADPVHFTDMETPRNGSDLTVRGNLVFLTEEKSIQIIDTDDPENPETLSVIWINKDLGGSEVILMGEFLYVSVYSSKEIRKYDISDPANPVLEDEIDLSAAMPNASPGGMAESGGYLYVSMEDFTDNYVFCCIDPEESGSSAIVKTVQAGSSSTGEDVCAAGDWLFIPLNGSTAMYNVADTDYPLYELSFGAESDLKLYGNYIFIGTDRYQLMD